MWFDIQAANEMAKERIETGMRNAQREARYRGYAPHPRRSFNLVKRLTNLFQRRKSIEAPVPETNPQPRTV